MNKNDNFIMSPKVDYCFKELMEDPKVRQGFIAALLGCDIKDVKKTILLPTILRREFEEDKWGVLDVHVQMEDGREIDIEMQVPYQIFWDKRTLFYLAKMYTSTIKEGDSFKKLKKCIHVGILDFELFPESREFAHCFHLWDDQERVCYSDMFEVWVIELPKLKRYNYKDTELKKWGVFFNSETKEDLRAASQGDKVMEKAFENIKKLSADEQKRREYEFHLHARMEKISALESAREEGYAQAQRELDAVIAQKDAEIERLKALIDNK